MPEPHLNVSPASSTLQRPKFLFAGPCSAETESQILEVAASLSGKVDYMRAGIWKPRTSPNSFEGIGKEGLVWLQKAQQLYGIKVATEVANAKHVEEALLHGVNLLWIGARTTVNPFAVQEIAEALRGVKIPVMVKNPVNPDLGLWIGAIKRMANVGIQEIMACHRGFNVYHKQLLRNAPLWEIPLEFKRLYPEIPMICDPSHICGNRNSLSFISQKSMDLGYDGLIIETHPHPDAAWSDAAQQITPLQFEALIASLRYRKHTSDDQLYNTRMHLLRNEIDEIDTHLMELVAARLEAARKIGNIKNQNGVAFYQHDRFSEVVTNCKNAAEKLGIHEGFALKLLELIHLESLEIQGE